MIANGERTQRVQYSVVESALRLGILRWLLTFVKTHSGPLPHAPCRLILHVLQL